MIFIRDAVGRIRDLTGAGVRDTLTGAAWNEEDAGCIKESCSGHPDHPGAGFPRCDRIGTETYPDVTAFR